MDSQSADSCPAQCWSMPRINRARVVGTGGVCTHVVACLDEALCSSHPSPYLKPRSDASRQ
eukprot:945494-Amphidinium_carterae.2